jgi:hypothetical protein
MSPIVEENGRRGGREIKCGGQCRVDLVLLTRWAFCNWEIHPTADCSASSNHLYPDGNKHIRQ